MTFAEQIIMLALDPKTGKFHALPRKSLEIGLAGAFLLELEFRDVIDADLDKIIVLEEHYPKRPLLNAALQIVREDDKEIPMTKAIGRLALQGHLLVSKTLEKLVDDGILNRSDHIFFFRRERPVFPQADDEPYCKVVDQIRELVLDPEAIPEPKEVALLSLVEACRLQRKIFSEEEREKYEDRFQQLAKMDLVGQGIINVVKEVRDRELVEIAGE